MTGEAPRRIPGIGSTARQAATIKVEVKTPAQPRRSPRRACPAVRHAGRRGGPRARPRPRQKSRPRPGVLAPLSRCSSCRRRRSEPDQEPEHQPPTSHVAIQAPIDCRADELGQTHARRRDRADLKDDIEHGWPFDPDLDALEPPLPSMTREAVRRASTASGTSTATGMSVSSTVTNGTRVNSGGSLIRTSSPARPRRSSGAGDSRCWRSGRTAGSRLLPAPRIASVSGWTSSSGWAVRVVGRVASQASSLSSGVPGSRPRGSSRQGGSRPGTPPAALCSARRATPPSVAQTGQEVVQVRQTVPVSSVNGAGSRPGVGGAAGLVLAGSGRGFVEDLARAARVGGGAGLRAEVGADARELTGVPPRPSVARRRAGSRLPARAHATGRAGAAGG